MFYSETLLSKEGPLAQVWLAANLEKKLHKSQFLQSNITDSTQAIAAATSNNDDSEALALRLSGQLLYGVVRIYSRKAKYLLDDVSDALLKLKSAFKSTANSVTLPINATVVPSVNQLMLQDTITQSDLLYQEPLVFDDEISDQKKAFFGQNELTNEEFDDSIEIPRNKFDDLDELQPDDGFDLDLNFDIDEERVELTTHSDNNFQINDESIEVARADVTNANLSALDDEGFGGDIDLGFDGDFFDKPLEIIEEPEAEDLISQELNVSEKKQRKKRISTAGQRKIIKDKEIEIPIRNFSITENIVAGNFSSEDLDLNTKRAYIDHLLKDNYIENDLLLKIRSKRQKTVASPPAEDDVPELDFSEEDANKTAEDILDDGFDVMNLDWDEDRVPVDENNEKSEQEKVIEEEIDDFISGATKDGVSESTIKISSHIKRLTTEERETNFSQILEQDLNSEHPLSTFPKSEATRVFFELLVLSTNDAVKLKQDELFGQIEVTSRAALFKKFT
ncbi:hypothetical protein WICMUC_002544 [Wickerhamomyces mucosus]|uniref:Rad21/Rec8-like protein N-terminal domain-containing protein n=1 Tax=Wickerhamomyces mucosus TaxID=1378264 RepID=A0A9P8PPH2_9ASCO|nr:hypothetical protein WICMUC_002544 [Wickerhamomyces mucosus]